MLTLRDHDSGDLFDPWEFLGPKRRRLLERSWAGVFRDCLLQHLPVGELSRHFDDDLGRPTKDLYVALGALILQQLHDFTDKQTTEAVALNIAWHYALDIRNESDTYLCERTLRNYRRKILDSNLDEVLFRTLTDQLIEQFDVDTNKQRLDSTAVRSAIRGLTRLGILVEAVSKFLRELKRAKPDQFLLLDAELTRKYVDRVGNGCFANTRPSESKRRLPESAQDVYLLVERFSDTDVENLDSFQLLHRIFREQCEVVDDAETPVKVRPPSKTGCSGVVNPADPDATYNKHRGTGYLVQIMETYGDEDSCEQSESEPAKPDFITHVSVDPVTMHDRNALEPAIDDTESRGVKPKEILADSALWIDRVLGEGPRQEGGNCCAGTYPKRNTSRSFHA